MSESYQKLISILKEMFQLDQSDLDFGIYRIMNYKRNEIEKFLNEDLLPQVRTELEKYISVEQKSIEKELKELTKRLEEDGVPFESSTKYVALKSKLDNGLSVTSVENEVYSHLANFFRRYYSNGDFISLRRYKKDVYALPYEGEEVKLHWANADQYYIKTAEHFRDYSFTTPDGKKVHFKLVDAETENDNNKSEEGKERRFILAQDEPLVEENGELFIRFIYIINETKQQDLTSQALEIISQLITKDSRFTQFKSLLSLQPTEKNPKRTLIEKYLNDYTSRNKFDYFIHKDLGGFLKRELDFYIKNEVMFLDDVDIEDNLKVEQYLAKIRVIKKIGHKIIDFLKQIEDFQKRLWLKKKFVVDTNYCITLDNIGEEFYPEILQNTLQLEEWVKLYSIDDIKEDLKNIGHSNSLTVEFLKQNPYLVLDTAFFDIDFKERLIASIEQLDERIDGVLIKSENFQALNLISKKYEKRIKCIYIDPPYNTGKDEFLYKDNYRHSSWLSMINDRINLFKIVLTTNGVNMVSIGNHELSRLMLLMNSKYGEDNLLNVFIWNTDGNIDNQSKYKQDHEYIVAYSMNKRELPAPKVIDPNVPKESKLYKKHIENTIVKNGPKNPKSDILIPAGFPTSFKEGFILPGKEEYPKFEKAVEVKDWKTTEPFVINSGWSSKALLEKFINNGFQPITDSKGQKTWFELRESGAPYVIKERLDNGHVLTVLKNLGSTQSSSNMLEGMGIKFSYPKPVPLIQYMVSVMTDKEDIVMDTFAGSGTTGHAVINLNREDGGKRKYILVEMGEYFESIIKPRMKKVIYSKDWKNNKPVSREGSSHIFKYISLESYEDTLNNLEINLTQEQLSLLEQNPELREQYMLSYMLNNETENSMSLLNIDMFKNPFEYKMKIAKGLETQVTTIDLVETFNYLLGLEVIRNEKRERYNAVEDKDSTVPGAVKLNSAKDGEYVFKEIEGRTLDGEKVLVIWRTLSDDIVKDNAVLDAYFLKKKYSTRDFEFDRIYVNGDNNLQNLRMEDERWKVVLIEEEFKKLMFDVQDI